MNQQLPHNIILKKRSRGSHYLGHTWTKALLYGFIFSLLLLAHIPAAQAYTETLRPVGPGNATNWNQSPASGSNWDKVDEVTRDDDTTYVYTSSSVYDLYEVADHSTGSGTINSVTIHAWAARETGIMSGGRTMLRTQSTNYAGTNTIVNATAPTYEEITEVYANNPNTGTAWSWTQVDAMEIGFARSAGNMRCTQIYVVVDYTPEAHHGIVTTPIGTGDDVGYSIKVQDDGKIVVGGYFTNTTDRDFFAIRYHADLGLDTSFDTDGIATHAIWKHDEAESVLIQPDGKILLGGRSNVNGSTCCDQFTVARLNTDGSADTGFDSNGHATTSIGSSWDLGRTAGLQSDGKIVLGGYVDDGAGNWNFALLRYNADGSLDPSFNPGGTYGMSPNNESTVVTSVGAGDDYGNSLVIQSDGKILLAGATHNGTDWDWAIVRYEADGDLDTTFGTGGIVTTDLRGYNDWGSSIALQSDGKIVFGSKSSNGTDNDFAVVRYNTDGSIDTTFGTNGKVFTTIGSGDDDGEAVSIQSDGKIVLAGYTSNGTDTDFAVVRYNSDGSLDTSFGSGGKVVTPVGSGADQAHGVTVQSDGKILVVGETDNGTNLDVAVVRYNTDGTPDESNAYRYRSVGTSAADLNTNNRTVTISGSTATFSDTMPDNVGVGDALSYNDAASDVTYYFNGYGAERWTNYPNMTDGLTSSHAWTSGDGNTQLNTNNTCPGTDLGTITKVELRVHGGANLNPPTEEDDDIILRPVFGGTIDGTDYQVDMPASGGVGAPNKDWSVWVDITNDSNAPSTWGWSDVQNLDCDVVHKQVNNLENMLAGKVEIRVAYSSGQDQLAFIHGRTSSTVFTVKDKDGGTPTAASAGTAVGVYRSYTSLANWENQIENPNITEPIENDVNPSTDLTEATGDNIIMMVACYAGASVDNDAVVIDNWTTGPNNYIKIYTPVSTSEVGTSQRHNGIWDTGAYSLEVGGDTVLDIREENVRVDGLQVRLTTATSSVVGIEMRRTTSEIGDYEISNCIIRGNGDSAQDIRIGINLWDDTGGGASTGVLKAWNNIIYDWLGGTGNYVSGIVPDHPNYTFYLYNNTVVDCEVGIERNAGTVITKNNLVHSIITNDGDYIGTFNGSSNNNLGEESTGPSGGGTYIQTSQDRYAMFVDPDNDNFQIKTTSDAYDAGIDQVSEIGFTNDIAGDTRSGTWDIGADEIDGLIHFRSGIQRPGMGVRHRRERARFRWR
jgi:uncharacterized delta-60 repeat protein